MDVLEFFRSVALPLLGLVVLVVVGWFGVVAIRRWMQRDTDSSGAFSLDDLRRLHREGKLSDAEFSRAREAMIGSVRSSARAVEPSAGLARSDGPAQKARKSRKHGGDDAV